MTCGQTPSEGDSVDTRAPSHSGERTAHGWPAVDGWWTVILSCGCMVNRLASDEPSEGDDWCCPEHGDEQVAEEVRWQQPTADRTPNG